jgi:hypothetical protein
MLLDYYYYLLENFPIVLSFTFFITLPILIIYSFFRSIIYKIKKIKRIDGIFISKYSYDVYKYDADKSNISVKKHLSKLFTIAANNLEHQQKYRN